MRKEIQDKDIPAIVHGILKREAAILLKVVKALRRDIGSKRKQMRREKFGF